jgi:hypothetical protein
VIVGTALSHDEVTVDGRVLDRNVISVHEWLLGNGGDEVEVLTEVPATQPGQSPLPGDDHTWRGYGDEGIRRELIFLKGNRVALGWRGVTPVLRTAEGVEFVILEDNGVGNAHLTLEEIRKRFGKAQPETQG